MVQLDVRDSWVRCELHPEYCSLVWGPTCTILTVVSTSAQTHKVLFEGIASEYAPTSAVSVAAPSGRALLSVTGTSRVLTAAHLGLWEFKWDIHQLKMWHLRALVQSAVWRLHSVSAPAAHVEPAPTAGQQLSQRTRLLGNVSFNWSPVSRGGGREEEQPREGPRLVHQPQISKYLCCDPHLSAQCCSFLGQKHYVSGKIHQRPVFMRRCPRRFIPNCQRLQ